jgi:hypothetical protein
MILAIGDSNLYPACTESGQPIDPTNMAVVFSEHMNQPFTCWSKNGASNYWIESHIEYFLADSQWDPDTMLFIGWTSFEREEWPWLYSNISVCGGPDFGMPEPMKAKFNQWKITLTDEYVQDCINMWHDRIYQMHLRLRERNIPHLFWTTYDNFKSINNQHDWHDNFYRPYDPVGCMCKVLEEKQLTAIDGDPFHYNATAQATWATELSTYAKKIL